jgi:hypothetical protein
MPQEVISLKFVSGIVLRVSTWILSAQNPPALHPPCAGRLSVFKGPRGYRQLQLALADRAEKDE